MAIFYESDRVILKTVDRYDLPEIYALMSDPEISELTGEVYPMTERDLENFYESCQKPEERIWFLIYDKETQQIIGETGFWRMFLPWRTTELSLIIWKKDFWQNGYGKEVADIILNYAFNRLGMNRLAISVVGFNTRALKFWSSLGFIEEGRQREAYFCRGEFSDLVMMSLLKSDFDKIPKRV